VVAIIDDDTFINPKISEMVSYSSLMTNRPTFYGCKYGGGAGLILNKALLRILIEPTNRSHPKHENWSYKKTLLWKDNHWVPEEFYESHGSPLLLFPTESLMDRCLDLQFGGNWCRYPSDWVISDCLSKESEVHVRNEGIMHHTNVLKRERKGKKEREREPLGNSTIDSASERIISAAIKKVILQALTIHYMNPEDMYEVCDIIMTLMRLPILIRHTNKAHHTVVLPWCHRCYDQRKQSQWRSDKWYHCNFYKENAHKESGIFATKICVIFVLLGKFRYLLLVI
jgi:hypothetical protein